MVVALVPADITWEVSARCYSDIFEFRESDGYADAKAALKSMLCGYFNGNDCMSKQGKTVSPIESGVVGAKGFKVRWLVPGGGKSGGLRMAVLAYCESRRVVIAGAWMRKEDPRDKEFAAAFTNASAGV